MKKKGRGRPRLGGQFIALIARIVLTASGDGRLAAGLAIVGGDGRLRKGMEGQEMATYGSCRVNVNVGG